MMRTNHESDIGSRLKFYINKSVVTITKSYDKEDTACNGGAMKANRSSELDRMAGVIVNGCAKDLVQNNFPEFLREGVRAHRIEIWNPLPAGEGRVRAKAPDVSTGLSQAQGAQALTPTPLPQGNAVKLRRLGPLSLRERARVRAKAPDCFNGVPASIDHLALTPPPLPQGEGLQCDPIGTDCSETSVGDFREVIVGHILRTVAKLSPSLRSGAGECDPAI